MAFALEHSAYHSYEIYLGEDTDAEDGLLDHCKFDYNVIFRLEEGQFLQLWGCTISPIDEVTQIDYGLGQEFKVGYHIPAGTYRLESYGYGSIFYILSEPTCRRSGISSYSFLFGETDVTVTDGQYLLLVGCSIIGEAEACGSLQGGTGLSKEEYPATVYQPGTYMGGMDIPAGEYVLFAASERLFGKFSDYELRADGNVNNLDGILDHWIFDYNAIIQIEDGEYLYLNDCVACPIGEVPQINTSRGEMYKVGYLSPPALTSCSRPAAAMARLMSGRLRIIPRPQSQ